MPGGLTERRLSIGGVGHGSPSGRAGLPTHGQMPSALRPLSTIRGTTTDLRRTKFCSHFRFSYLTLDLRSGLSILALAEVARALLQWTPSSSPRAVARRSRTNQQPRTDRERWRTQQVTRTRGRRRAKHASWAPSSGPSG